MHVQIYCVCMFEFIVLPMLVKFLLENWFLTYLKLINYIISLWLLDITTLIIVGTMSHLQHV